MSLNWGSMNVKKHVAHENACYEQANREMPEADIRTRLIRAQEIKMQRREEIAFDPDEPNNPRNLAAAIAGGIMTLVLAFFVGAGLWVIYLVFIALLEWLGVT